MKIGLINFLLSDPSYYVNVPYNSSIEKITVYHKFWPEMIRRPKFTGFENIWGKEIDRKYMWTRKEKIGSLPIINLPIEQVKSQLKLET
jgi:hypothetical protein